jgi:tagatose kinase
LAIKSALSSEALGPTVTVGEILVEIMATTVGTGFLAAQPLLGPFPSGAPAIFIDQVARIGGAAGIVAAVGDDDFGTLNIERLRASRPAAPSSVTATTAHAISSSTSRIRPPAKRA